MCKKLLCPSIHPLLLMLVISINCFPCRTRKQFCCSKEDAVHLCSINCIVMLFYLKPSIFFVTVLQRIHARQWTNGQNILEQKLLSATSFHVWTRVQPTEPCTRVNRLWCSLWGWSTELYPPFRTENRAICILGSSCLTCVLPTMITWTIGSACLRRWHLKTQRQ